MDRAGPQTSTDGDRGDRRTRAAGRVASTAGAVPALRRASGASGRMRAAVDHTLRRAARAGRAGVLRAARCCVTASVRRHDRRVDCLSRTRSRGKLSRMRDRTTSLSYRLGLAVLRGVPTDEAPPWLVYDARLDALVAPGHRFVELRAWAVTNGIAETAEPDQLDAPLLDPRTPRPYQRDAVERWRASGGRGTVVLPTGAGKTLVALLAIDELQASACIVAPTRALVAQWFTQLAHAFGVDRVGAYYGDEKE